MKKTNNKGFSLVELIIVIAIMAILIGVLAPQYIKYVEKSRISADKDTIDSLTKAVQTACTDDDYFSDLAVGDSVVIDNNNGVVTNGATLVKAIDEFYGTKDGKMTEKKFKSKSFKDEVITISIIEKETGQNKAKIFQTEVKNKAGDIYDPSNYK